MIIINTYTMELNKDLIDELKFFNDKKSLKN